MSRRAAGPDRSRNAADCLIFGSENKKPVALSDGQVRDGFQWLEASLDEAWLVGDAMTQADVTVAVFWSFGRHIRPGFFGRMHRPRLDALTDRLEATAPFLETQREPETLTNKI